MLHVKIPTVGESITEATIANWKRKDGEYVNTGDVLLEIETDKANVEVVADGAGVLKTIAKEGDVVKIGAIVGEIDNTKAASAIVASKAQPIVAPPTAPNGNPAPRTTPSPNGGTQVLSPAVRHIVGEKGIDPSGLQGTGKGGRLTKADVLTSASEAKPLVPTPTPTPTQPLPIAPRRDPGEYIQERKKMTTIRKRIAERLVHAQNTAAILTTFNDVDMSAINQIREAYKDSFKEKYGISLGMMGFFVKASVAALKKIPEVNGWIEGDEVVYNRFYNIGIAVGTPRGLIVPVVRDADLLTLPQIELVIRDFAVRGRDGKIKPDELQGGTFTVSNGGVYGSLMSTPILNPPQSGILGMHRTENRPVVIGNEIKIRPMMYVALSYDHRLIDGEQSVTFLKTVKQNLEDPHRLLIEI